MAEASFQKLQSLHGTQSSGEPRRAQRAPQMRDAGLWGPGAGQPRLWLMLWLLPRRPSLRPSAPSAPHIPWPSCPPAGQAAPGRDPDQDQAPSPLRGGLPTGPGRGGSRQRLPRGPAGVGPAGDSHSPLLHPCAVLSYFPLKHVINEKCIRSLFAVCLPPPEQNERLLHLMTYPHHRALGHVES